MSNCGVKQKWRSNLDPAHLLQHSKTPFLCHWLVPLFSLNCNNMLSSKGFSAQRASNHSRKCLPYLPLTRVVHNTCWATLVTKEQWLPASNKTLTFCNCPSLLTAAHAVCKATHPPVPTCKLLGLALTGSATGATSNALVTGLEGLSHTGMWWFRPQLWHNKGFTLSQMIPSSQTLKSI